jgi:hypothetical protein
MAAVVSPRLAPAARLLVSLVVALVVSLTAATVSTSAVAMEPEEIDDEDFGPIPSKPAPKKTAPKGGKTEGTGPMPEGDDEDPEWDAPREPRPAGGGEGGGGFDEDPDFDDPELAPEKPKPAPAPKPAAPSGPARLALNASGKAPLADNFPGMVVAKDVDAVIVELPVLVAAKGADHKADYWVIAEMSVGTVKVGESRTWVSKTGIADLGPTFVWIKAHVPVADNAGEVVIKLSKQAEGGQPTALFSKTVAYSL